MTRWEHPSARVPTLRASQERLPNVDARLPMVLITSWTEWNEYTEIEPVAPTAATAVDDGPSGSFYTGGNASGGPGPPSWRW